MNHSSFLTLSQSEALVKLNTNLDTGLSREEAQTRQKKYGLNQISVQETFGWQILLRQFKSAFVYLLAAAALLALILHEILDASFILLFVFINAALGFYQEYRSEKTLELLKEYTIKRARVKRDGELTLIDSRQLVPGDIVTIEAGDFIPADLRFLTEHNLSIDESVLTGESVPVKKIVAPLSKAISQIYQAQNIGFMGSSVQTGQAQGVVIATGQQTAFGKISRLTVETERKSAFEKGIAQFSNFILKLILATLLFVFLLHLVIKPGAVPAANLAIFAIALAVGVIPEALPLVTTFSLSRGALRLAKNKVVVKRLSAIEDLGSIEVLCADKTGTLTENKLAVAEIKGDSPQNAIFYAVLASPFSSKKDHTLKSSFDLALFEKLDHRQKLELKNYQKLEESPFDPERRKNSVLVQKDKNRELIVRGAPEVILPFLKNPKKVNLPQLLEWIREQGQKGQRIIAVAKKKDDGEFEEKNLEFLGLISFTDPIKKTAFEAVKKAQSLGVTIKILTGDAPEVAACVAYDTGISDSSAQVLTGEMFEKLPSYQQHQAIKDFSVFARVTPSQKYKIIELLQEKHVVGFLGEGINDAPALKIANVGLVVQGAADIAQEAADIVLLGKSLNIIVDGIKEGREVFANTVKYIKATLISNFGNFYAVAIASLMIDFLPMLPLQILLLNLLSDFPMIAISADSVDLKEVKTPKTYNIKDITLAATILGAVSTLFDFIFFALFYKFGASILQTNWFIGSVLTELALIFSIRTKLPFFKAKKPAPSLILLSTAAFLAALFLPFSFLGQKVFDFTSPNLWMVFVILDLTALYFLCTETTKLLFYKLENHSSRG